MTPWKSGSVKVSSNSSGRNIAALADVGHGPLMGRVPTWIDLVLDLLKTLPRHYRSEIHAQLSEGLRRDVIGVSLMSGEQDAGGTRWLTRGRMVVWLVVVDPKGIGTPYLWVSRYLVLITV